MIPTWSRARLGRTNDTMLYYGHDDGYPLANTMEIGVETQRQT